MNSSASLKLKINRALQRESEIFEKLDSAQRRSWFRVRFYILSDIFKLNSQLERPLEISSRGWGRRLISLMCSLPSFFLCGHQVKKAKHIILLHPRAEDGEDPYMADILGCLLKQDPLREDVLLLGLKRAVSRYSVPSVAIDFVYVFSKICGLLFLPLALLQCKRNQMLSALSGSGKVEVALAKELAQRVVEKSVQKVLFSSAFGKTVSVEKLYLTVSYCNVALIQSARECFPSVKIVEMQHGLISAFHLGYSSMVLDNSGTADIFALLGQDWLSQIDAYPAKLVVVGNSSLAESKFEGASSLISANPLDRKVKPVLIISQRVLSPLMAAKIKESLDSDDLIRFTIKLHPSEYEDGFYDDLLASGRVEVFKNIDIQECLKHCQYIVGVYSTLLLELLQSGFYINVLDLPGAEKLPSVEGGLNLVAALSSTNLIAKNSPVCSVNFFSGFEPVVFREI